jgi:ketosteroid isomerase-like protein
MATADVMRRYLGAARAMDWETAYACFAEDIALRIPGRSEFAGEFRGRDVARRYIEAARARSHEADVELEVVDTLLSEERFALIVVERFRSDGAVTEIRRANVYRVRGDEIAEIWIFEGDQYEVDALFGAGT